MDRNDSFREFVAGHQQALMRTAYLLTGDPHQAEDLLQSVLLKVLGRWSRLSRVERPEAYARKALLNQYISWRRRRVRTELPTAEPPDRPYSSEDSTVVRLVMRQALMRLPPRQRAVIVLRYYEDRTERAAAELLNCSIHV
ncbi:SigE family RNA polymerase sigma factor [Nonomuraea sp. NPDC046802]|uniref:SigE family RNA polymerase sigma factor n=1 Tax=Nonomuraea sp. NPDC046802 TaxID=3154919 RepID=UPI0033E1187C